MTGVRQYGRDFCAISEVLGTKTERQVHAFYINYEQMYGLDQLVREREEEVCREVSRGEAVGVRGGSRTG